MADSGGELFGGKLVPKIKHSTASVVLKQRHETIRRLKLRSTLVTFAAMLDANCFALTLLALIARRSTGYLVQFFPHSRRDAD
jgi:hypothetical protein